MSGPYQFLIPMDVRSTRDKCDELFLVESLNNDFCLVRLYLAFDTNLSFVISPFAIEFGVCVIRNNVTHRI